MKNTIVLLVKKQLPRLALLALLVSVLTGCATSGTASTPTPLPTPVVPQKPTYTVQSGTVSKALELRGRVSAVQQEDLFFRTNGNVDVVAVSRGDTVTAGQVLAYLGERQSFELAVADAEVDVLKAQKALDALTDEVEVALKLAEAQMAVIKGEEELEKAKRDRYLLGRPRADALTIREAEAQFALAEENLKYARMMYDKVAHLPADDPEKASAVLALAGAQRARDSALSLLNWYKGHTSEQEIAKADAEVALAEAKLADLKRKYDELQAGPAPYDISIAKAQVIRAEANLKKAQSNLESLEITAPFDGVVQALSLVPGAQVTAYKNVMTLVDPGGLEITLLPSQTELADISVGQAATVRLNSRPGQEFPATVRFVPLPAGSSGGQGGQSNEQYVRVTLDDSNAPMTMGEIATVTLRLEEHPDVLWLPPAALRTFQGRDFVIIQDGEIQRRVDVRLGLRSAERVEVLEGLAAGQVVLGP